MKIVITGVNGFVGGCLANYFSTKNYEITGIGRQPELAAFVNKKCEYIYADITKPLKIFKTDVVIHAAALASDTANFDILYKSNVGGTQNVLNASFSASTFIQVSTSSVYNFNINASVEHEAAKNFDVLSGYGQTKFLAEQKVLANENIRSKYILRPKAIYGINDRLILPRLLKFVKGNYLLLPKHITTKISLTHIENFTAAVELCILKPQHNKIYNVADDEVYALGDIIVNLVSTVTEKKLNVLNIPSCIWSSIISLNQILIFNKDLSKFGSNQLTKYGIMDISAIKSEMGYVPKKKIFDSYREIAGWIISNGGWKKYLKQYESIAKARS